MKLIHVLFLLALTGSLAAQSPIKETLAYSRKMIPGIPGAGLDTAQKPLPTSYFLYVIVKKGTAISATGVCLERKRYDATLKKVDSPVVMEHDPNVPTGKRDTLVRKTAHDVYQVEIEGPKDKDGLDCGRDKLAQQYQAVVYLKSGKATWHGLARKIVPLRPVAAP